MKKEIVFVAGKDPEEETARCSRILTRSGMFRALLRRIFLALSFARQPTEADARRMAELMAFTGESLRSENPTAYGAEVVENATGRSVARARNGVATRGDPTAHAEVLAIREACSALGSLDLSTCTLYTTCEPCAMCMGAAHWARIGRVVYGFTLKDSARYFPEISLSARSIAARSPFRCHVIGPVARAEGLALIGGQAARFASSAAVKSASPR
jgi:tRNA(Arg) A34 adenosine deaminase TadA